MQVKKHKTFLLLAVAVIFSVAAAYTANVYLARKEEALLAKFNDREDYVAIVVPVTNLQVGDTISMETVAAHEIPRKYVPSGTLLPGDFEAVEGMVVKEPVPEGSPLLRHHVDGLTGVDRFSQLLKKGERAVTIARNNLNSNENLILPGDMVDVLVKIGSKGNDDVPPRLISVLDQRRVLAIDFTTIADPSIYQQDTSMKGYSSMTLSVGSSEVSTLLAAEATGELVLLVRNAEELGPGRYGALERFESNLASAEGVRVYSADTADDAVVTPKLVPFPSSRENRWTHGKSGRLYQKLTPRELQPTLREPLAQTTE